jgi:hypothetical protein
MVLVLNFVLSKSDGITKLIKSLKENILGDGNNTIPMNLKS